MSGKDLFAAFKVKVTVKDCLITIILLIRLDCFVKRLDYSVVVKVQNSSECSS